MLSIEEYRARDALGLAEEAPWIGRRPPFPP